METARSSIQNLYSLLQSLFSEFLWGGRLQLTGYSRSQKGVVKKEKDKIKASFAFNLLVVYQQLL